MHLVFAFLRLSSPSQDFARFAKESTMPRMARGLGGGVCMVSLAPGHPDPQHSLDFQ